MVGVKNIKDKEYRWFKADAGQGELKTAQMQGGMYSGPDGKKAKRVNLDFNQVPKKYHTPETSPLTTTINSGSNTFDIDVPSK